MAKVNIQVEVDVDSIPREVADYAIDQVVNGPMTYRYGSMATNELRRKYGDVLMHAANELIGKPLAAELKPHEDAMDAIIGRYVSKYVKQSGRTV